MKWVEKKYILIIESDRFHWRYAKSVSRQRFGMRVEETAHEEIMLNHLGNGSLDGW